jgi:PAS domain-containing protein
LLSKTQEQSQILQTTLADLTAIVDNLADGLLVSDIFGRITRYNPALVNLFNLEGVDTARGQEQDKQNGLLVGADFYMTKPFHPRDILAKSLDFLGLD